MVNLQTDQVLNTFTVHNGGNTDAYPIIKLTGPLSSPTLTNRTTGQKIIIAGNIDQGDSLEINIQDGTIVSADGTNAAALWDSTSDWIRIRGTLDDVTGEMTSGDNLFEFKATSFTLNSAVELTWHDTWI
jgi:hypothetical protein